MQLPEMILFDYGHTLLYEPDIDFLRGHQALFPHIVRNPRNLTAEQIHAFDMEVFAKYDLCRKQGFEVHEHQMLNLTYDTLKIGFDISKTEVESILWNNACPGAVMPHVEEMLEDLHRRGIRTAVISNLAWSTKALTERINRLLPNNHFEFIIASSEYGIRKPSTALFELALHKAGLTADSVWHCGDSVHSDVFGAYGAGIFPVLYENETIDSPWKEQNRTFDAGIEYLHIHDWTELSNILDTVEKYTEA